MPKLNQTLLQIKQLAIKKQQFLNTAKENQALFINLLTASYAEEAGASEASLQAASVSSEDVKLHYANILTLADANGQETEYLAVLRHSCIDGNKSKGKLRLDIFENHVDSIVGMGGQAMVWHLFATAYQDDNEKLQLKFSSIKKNAAAPISWVIKFFKKYNASEDIHVIRTPEQIYIMNNESKAEAMSELTQLHALGIPSKHELLQVKNTDGLIYYGIVTQNLGEIDIFTLLKTHYYQLEVAPKYHFTAELAWKLILGCINAAKEMNDKGWLHRDIKPENIVFSITPANEAVIKLVDYNSAAKLKELDGQLRGTLGYCAPEMYYYDRLLSAGVTAGYFAKADVYSLGWVIAFLSANHRELHKFFNRQQAQSISFQIFPFEMQEGFPLKVQQELKGLIDSMLQGNPKIRTNMTAAYERAQHIQKIWDEIKNEAVLLAEPYINDIVEVDIVSNSEAISPATLQVRQLTNFFQKVLLTEKAYEDVLQGEDDIGCAHLNALYKNPQPLKS